MNKQVIEVGGEAVGVVVPDADRLKFVAVKYHVWDLDSRLFKTADEARAAIRQLIAGRNARGEVLPARRPAGEGYALA